MSSTKWQPYFQQQQCTVLKHDWFLILIQKPLNDKFAMVGATRFKRQYHCSNLLRIQFICLKFGEVIYHWVDTINEKTDSKIDC